MFKIVASFKDGWVIVQRYFFKGYDYGEKADLSKTGWNLKRKMWVTVHFSEIVK